MNPHFSLKYYKEKNAKKSNQNFLYSQIYRINTGKVSNRNNKN